MVTEQQFRRVLGHLPTGVTIVTAGETQPFAGMACNSVTSVSLTPPLVSVCPAKTSTTWPEIRATQGFCVNVMSHDQEALCRRFATRGIDRFDGVAIEPGPRGPRLATALAWIDCAIHDVLDAGDHVIALGRVESLDAHPGVEPLIFFRGEYGRLSTAG
jgi:flavin reductase (DIM6/NTAB) family NADH-FMN oxidoreductase RutF